MARISLCPWVMAKKTTRPADRWRRQIRERLEGERQTAIDQLRAMGLSLAPTSDGARAGDDQPRDEGDQALASERQDLGAMTRERLAGRINRLSAALGRLQDGTYGQCESCGRAIETPRLEALPDATTCLSCQRDRERAA